MSKPIVVHIIHGMKDHVGRYADLIGFLENQGIEVVAQNRMGHGPEAQSNSTQLQSTLFWDIPWVLS